MNASWIGKCQASGNVSPFQFTLPILLRLEQLRGYNPLDFHLYKQFIQFSSDRDQPLTPGNGIGNFSLVNKTLLDLLGTRYRGAHPCPADDG